MRVRPSFQEVAWGAYFYRIASGYDESYLTLMRQDALLFKLRRAAETIPADEFKDTVVTFLNKWQGRHIGKRHAVGESLRDSLSSLRDAFVSLENTKLVDIDLSANASAIDHVLSTLASTTWTNQSGARVKLGETFASKLAHVVNPELFVMWDNGIARNFRESGITSYIDFLREMQVWGRLVNDDCSQLKLGDDAAEFLSAQLGHAPGKTLAKYLDEHNWMVIQRIKEELIPPQWLLSLPGRH